ncbi:GGDEF domain-containing protein [Frankia sp. AgB1.9]|uniref:sensor domain-containing diguanylate cyclase n=1 Tax=unclassified Frankia TaxID=2632575 RepID=UPI00193433BE|nr:MULTISPECIES: sensor domain-containing diguanylate cyclase [unclassified Frankia]MBL7492585.1 GGDEF domain-containing protein [Frankia sp. AgW1.1]MBL7548738.1 GGDEF domain-containing protein [Frankia sp. AgB1.9]MBL7619336.1 GGDEF domain-containing protein [Frankia sp. AgB1.8]
MTPEEQSDLFELLDIAIVETGVRDHRLRRANEPTRALFGIAPGEIDRWTWEDATVPGELERRNEQARLRAASGPDRFRRVVRLVRPDHSVIHAVATTVLRTDADGEQCFLTHLQDVSEEIAAHDRLRLVVENTPVSMFLVGQDGRVLVREGTAVPQASAVLEEARDASVFTTFADSPQVTSVLRRALAGERVQEVIEIFDRCLEVHLVPIRGTDGAVSSVAAVATDITEREQALASLRLRTAELAAVADLGQRALEARDAAPLWKRAVAVIGDRLQADLVEMYELNADGNRARLLARADRRERPTATPTGTSPSGGERAACSPAATMAAEAEQAGVLLTASVGRPKAPVAKIEVRRAPGAAPFTDQEAGLVRSVAAVLGSAALRFRMEAEIRHRSLHDGLTGLPNRTALLDRLARALRRARRDGRRIGVLFIDLDQFKTINDTLGHQAGDALLRETAARLSAAVRPGDVVGRLAGDEFAVVCGNIERIADLEAIADRALAALRPPFLQGDRLIGSTASVGLAVSSPELRDGETLLNAADLAMYVAKRGGPGRRASYQGAPGSRGTAGRAADE